MNNQMIGIATVFALTVSLFAFRHLLISLGRPNRNRDVNPTLRRVSAESKPVDVEDDSWLLWSAAGEMSSANSAGEVTGASRTPTQGQAKENLFQ